MVLDCGDTTEKAKNARSVVAWKPTWSPPASYLKLLHPAVTEVTERANLPVLTLSYSDLITSRGHKYVNRPRPPPVQAEMSLPVMLAGRVRGTNPKTVAIITDNTGALRWPRSRRCAAPCSRSLACSWWSTTGPRRWPTPTPLIQKVRTARPDLLFALPTAVSTPS